jgi:hypothetical protein
MDRLVTGIIAGGTVKELTDGGTDNNVVNSETATNILEHVVVVVVVCRVMMIVLPSKRLACSRNRNHEFLVGDGTRTISEGEVLQSCQAKEERTMTTMMKN